MTRAELIEREQNEKRALVKKINALRKKRHEPLFPVQLHLVDTPESQLIDELPKQAVI